MASAAGYGGSDRIGMLMLDKCSSGKRWSRCDLDSAWVDE
jgi:hypothetical protein